MMLPLAEGLEYASGPRGPRGQLCRLTRAFLQGVKYEEGSLIAPGMGSRFLGAETPLSLEDISNQFKPLLDPG